MKNFYCCNEENKRLFLAQRTNLVFDYLSIEGYNNNMWKITLQTTLALPSSTLDDKWKKLGFR